MIDLYKNDQLYNIVAEGEISGILAHYNSDYIMSIIQDSIKNINIPGYTPANASNIVESFEMNFKDLKIQYPSDGDNIEQARQETYQEIIEIGLQIQNENIKVKYKWLNKYLGRVLLNEKFQQNIINIYTN